MAALQRRVWPWLLFFAVFYAASVVPVGLFIYTLKMGYDVNVFGATGFHGYVKCLDSEARKAGWTSGQPLESYLPGWLQWHPKPAAAEKLPQPHAAP
jgi:hypothetical protein